MEAQYAGSGSSVEELSRNAYANPLWRPARSQACHRSLES